MPGTDQHFAAVSACHCGGRASVGAYCLDHAPIHALRLEILRQRAVVAAKEEKIVSLDGRRFEANQELR